MTQSNENTESQGTRMDTQDVLLAQVRDSLRNLRFGHVQIIVQDGVVVQIDRLERRRISRNERQTP
ncbi:MAG: YezD family protein [Planctomycetia bacterium]